MAHLQGPTVEPRRPWRAAPPWASAELSGKLLAGVERQLSGEASSASGYVMAIPDIGDKGAAADGDEDGAEDPIDSFRSDLHAAAGRTVVAPAVGGGWGAGPGAAPAHEFKPARFGISPPAAAVELRRDIERSILAACGIPPLLASHAAAGTAMREGWRQFSVGTAEPIAVLMGDQLSEALGVAVTLKLPRSADLATLARALQSLTGAGVPADEARVLVGL